MALLWVRGCLILLWIFWPDWCKKQWKRIDDIGRVPEPALKLKEGNISIPHYDEQGRFYSSEQEYRKFRRLESDAQWAKLERQVYLEQLAKTEGEQRLKVYRNLEKELSKHDTNA